MPESYNVPSEKKKKQQKTGFQAYLLYKLQYSSSLD